MDCAVVLCVHVIGDRLAVPVAEEFMLTTNRLSFLLALFVKVYLQGVGIIFMGIVNSLGFELLSKAVYSSQFDSISPRIFRRRGIRKGEQ